MISIQEPTHYLPLFWDELEELLGPILQPIVGPVFDVLRDESFRSLMLQTVVIFVAILAGMMYLVYEFPIVFNWMTGGKAITSAVDVPKSPYTPSKRRPKIPSRKKQKPVKAEPKPKPRITQSHGVSVTSVVTKEQDQIVLTIKVANLSDYNIEMVVVDIDLPEGIDMATRSFRMKRLGKILSGDTDNVQFRLKIYDGDISKIRGHVEFMSGNLEISQMNIPAPEYE
ncbi:MAG: hypothetical protein ACTSQZ_03420 [Candidatus Thorarchaeota archaeon]